VNKQLASVCGFNYLVTVLFLNFSTTGIVLITLAALGGFKEKHLPDRDRWMIAFVAVGTVLLNNASNEANSVGFYQITKLMIVPTVLVIERLGGTKITLSGSLVLCLCLTSVGVAIATVSDFQVNFRGTVLAGFSTLLTARYQIWQTSKQREHGVSGVQITHSVSMPQMVVGLIATLIFDVCMPWIKDPLLLPAGGLLDHQLTRTDTMWIAICCTLAVGMNLSTYWILGLTSPITYQVLGQVKTCLIVLLGYMLFDVRVTPTWLCIRLSGVFVACVGAFSYATLKRRQMQSEKVKSK